MQPAHPRAPGPDGAVVLNLDARGASGPAIMFETSTGNSGLVARLREVRQPMGFSLS